jgi:uncharacterized protein
MRLRIVGVLFALLAAPTPTAFAYTSPGSPSGYVNDFADVLSPQAVQALEGELAAFEQTTSNEIAIAIVPNMGGDYLENYAVKLFDEWGIGKEDKDNGALLFLSIEEQKMRIEVGYGLEGALPDSVAQSILDNEMAPLLKAGDYDGAVTAGVGAIERATHGEYAGSSERSLTSFLPEDFFNLGTLGFFALQFLFAIFARSRSWWAGGMVGFLGGLGISWFLSLALGYALSLVTLLTLVGLFLDYAVSAGYEGAKRRGVRPPWWAGGKGFGGSHSGGGFGGGSSGGGGASGSW